MRKAEEFYRQLYFLNIAVLAVNTTLVQNTAGPEATTDQAAVMSILKMNTKKGLRGVRVR